MPCTPAATAQTPAPVPAGGKQTTVGRFAPTPSGRMHLGNLFSALLTWLSARAAGGRLIMRIEDLDLLRTSPTFTGEILRDLAWLGLDWDEGLYPPHGSPKPQPGGTGLYAPYLQSQRTAFYDACVEKLRQRGLVYGCFCSRAELHAGNAANAANAPHLGDGSYIYNRTCLHLTDTERAEKAKTRGAALRVQVPDTTIAFTDACQGTYSQNLAGECGDFILRRSDGVYAYQLCAPADDGAMHVTEVVRGRDLLSSAPRQIWLMQTLGYTPPRYCHVPLLLAPDGRRLSKRDEDLDVGRIRANLTGPEPLVGLLAYLAGLTETPAPVKAKDLLPVFSWHKIKKNDVKINQIILDKIK